MWSLFAFLFWLALAQLALLLLAFVFRRLFQVEHRRDAIHFADTDDGWRVAVSRHQPSQPREASPLLLVPGFGFDASIFEIGDGALAPALAEAGFDVWLLDPRGRGASTRPRLFGRHRGSWSLDDVMEFDIPAAVETVCRATSAERIHLLGFGGGALISLPLAAGALGERLQSITALGAAAFFGRQQEHVSTRSLALLRWLRPRFVVRLLSPLLGRFDLPPLRALQLLDNVDGPTYRRALVEAISDLAPRELQQLRGWFEQDCYRALEEGPDYREQLALVSPPVFFICGPRDRLAPPSMVRATLDACISARERSMLVASREDGLSCNYGHLDLLLGRAVRRDLLPRIVAWLERWDQPAESFLAEDLAEELPVASPPAFAAGATGPEAREGSGPPSDVGRASGEPIEEAANGAGT